MGTDRLRCQRAQLVDESRQDLDDSIDISLRGQRAETEPEGVLRAVRGQPHRLEDVRWLECARRAGGARRHRHALEIERNQQALGLDAVEADVGGVRDTRFANPVDRGAGDRAEDSLLEAIAKLLHTHGLRRQLASGKTRGNPQTRNGRNVLGAGAPVTFVLAAGQDRVHSCAALDPQRAGSLRSIELVGRQREEIDAECSNIDGNLADRLHGVGVKHGVTLVRDGRQFRDRLNRANLVVRVHDRHEDGVIRLAGGWFEGLPQTVGRDNPCLVYRQERGAPPPSNKRPERVQDGFVLDSGRDEMTSPGWFQRFGHPPNRKIVTLGSAAREDHLGRLAANQSGDGRAGIVQNPLGLLAKMMDARRVSKEVEGHMCHRLDDVWSDRGGRVVVKVDTHRESYILTFPAKPRQRKD